MMQYIEAYDKSGGRFGKKISILSGCNQEYNEYGYYGDIISFGWPCEYYVRSLLRKYPYKNDLCIDIMGSNHKGSPVYIKKDDLNAILKELKEKYESKQEK